MSEARERHLRIAREAVRHVTGLMNEGPGPDNRTRSGAYRSPQPGSCAERINGDSRAELQRLGSTSQADFYAIVASLTYRRKCGNCGPQSALAMNWILVEYELTSWVTFMDLYDTMGIDHQFLVIGMKDGAQVSSPETWGPDAVVCDPWHGRSYPARDIHQGMYRGANYSQGGKQGVFKVQPRAILRGRWDAAKAAPEWQETGPALVAPLR